MRTKVTQKYKYIYATTDFMIFMVSFLFSFYLVSFIDHSNFHNYGFGYYYNIIGLISLSFLFLYIFQVNHLYKSTIIINRKLQISRIFISIKTGIVLLILLSIFALMYFETDYLYVSGAFIISSSTLIFLIRVEFLRKIYNRLINKYYAKKIIVVGCGSAGKKFASQLVSKNEVGLNIVGFICNDCESGTEIYDGLKIIGHTDQIKDIISQNGINEIIIASDQKNYSELFNLIDFCIQFGIEIKVASDLFKPIQQRIFIEKYADIPLIEMYPKYKEKKFDLHLKRVFDISVSVLGLIVCIPLFLVIMISIKLTSKGPIIFKQKRIGKDGKTFQFYKFRSMRIIKGEDQVRMNMMIDYIKNGKTQGNGTSKIINDSRVTSVGRFLRKSSLDELPQLVNVLKGEMSIVGPRPCLPYEYEQYEEWQKRRSAVKPGCTGVWQVTARSSVSFSDSILLDLYYVNNFSPSLDFQLLLKTIPVMLFAKGGK
jgi:exopolysaccharide biosynthesis polyprenyl glycosylphosphotransferase